MKSPLHLKTEWKGTKAGEEKCLGPALLCRLTRTHASNFISSSHIDF